MMMKRLIKKADFETLDNAREVLEEVQRAVNAVHQSYVELFSNLNSLAENQKGLYDELKMVVRFPDERDAKGVSDMKEDLEELMSHYDDDGYLRDTLRG